MRYKRRKERKRLARTEISLTPLIDTSLTLLIIFIVAAPMLHYSIKVRLPGGKTQEVEQEAKLVVSLTESGDIYCNATPVSRENLAAEVKKNYDQTVQTPVFINADKARSYGDVISIVDELKRAGITFVAMTTSPDTK